MAPIRVGLVGLGSQAAAVAPGAWGVCAHLPAYSSPHYELVAVCNSSVESARRAIEYHSLPSTVKAYGSAEDLAKDPNVDLVVVSVAVMKHHSLAKPALLANKQAFVEWPLGASTAQAEELHRLAEERGLRTVVGLQLRGDPLIVKAKQLVKTGAIGRVLSSNLLFHPSMVPVGTWLDGIEYYLDFKSGANDYHVGFAHVLDAFTYVLGDFEFIQPLMRINYPTVQTLDSQTGEVVKTNIPKTAPDHVFVQGELQSGALASITMRKTHKTVNGHSLLWIITGTEGELELTISGSGIQMGGDPQKLRMTVGRNGETTIVDINSNAVPAPEHITAIPPPGTNTARVYEAFAKDGPGYADFADAVKLHKLLDQIAHSAGFLKN